MSTILHRLARWANESPKDPAQSYLRQQEWKTVSSAELRDRVFHLALYLESKGMKPGEVSVIYAYNSPEWVQMDLAPQLLGGMSAGIYPNSTRKDIQYILEHTGTRVLAVQDGEYFRRITGVNEENPLPSSIELLLVFDGDTSISPKAVAFEKAISEGRKIAQAQGKKIEDYLNKITKNQGAFLIYTSGTTGHPKGAVLSHDNLVFTSDVAIAHWEIPSHGEMFSFLPLCHVAEKMQNVGVGISGRFNVRFSSKFENVSKELVLAQPTVLLSVPRLWEKMMEGAQRKIKEAPPAKQKLIRWALAVSSRVSEARMKGKFPKISDLLQQQLADRLVLSKIRQAMGLSKIWKAASGAAALPASVTRWFRSLGIEILEDYGQTESTGVICMTLPGVDCAGTVGKPVPGTEFKIAEDGEMLSKGRHIFIGYFKNDEATRSTVQDGWLQTGDLAEMTEQGLVRIRGRKKEILKTSGGKMVAPAPIEDRLKEGGVVSQSVMVGDQRKYLSMLVTLPEDRVAGVRAQQGTQDRVIRDPELNALVKRQMDDLNSTLASYEKVKQFRILSREFTIESGELTPTLKMKRNVIEQKYVDVINEMYSSETTDG